MKLHLVYIKGTGIRTPWAITNELEARLSPRYDVVIHDWEDRCSIVPEPGDILLGHPHPDQETVFQRSIRQEGWAKRIVIIPFRHRPYYHQVAWWDPLIRRADHLLAICGEYWTDTMADSLVSHWQYKTRRLDLAVNLDHFPRIKESFSPAGSRRFLYIGWDAPYKGFDFLLRLARANRDLDFGWMGPGNKARVGDAMKAWGMQDFSKSEARARVAEYDFLITCGRSDPNPTTILEAAAWGLVPVCTPQSGYYRKDWIENIPLDDVTQASNILARLNVIPEHELLAKQDAALHALRTHYTWDRFAEDVLACINAAPPQRPPDRAFRMREVRNRTLLMVWDCRRRTEPLVNASRAEFKKLRAAWWRFRARRQKRKDRGGSTR